MPLKIELSERIEYLAKEAASNVAAVQTQQQKPTAEAIEADEEDVKPLLSETSTPSLWKRKANSISIKKDFYRLLKNGSHPAKNEKGDRRCRKNRENLKKKHFALVFLPMMEDHYSVRKPESFGGVNALRRSIRAKGERVTQKQVID